jgi:hypothetical protein
MFLGIIEPSIYRTVIDEVVANIKSEFDEYGVSEDVLAELQSVKYFCIYPLLYLIGLVEMGDQSYSISCS